MHAKIFSLGRSGRMQGLTRIAAIALGSAALAACTSPAYVSPVEVTRFSAAETALLGSGTIRIEPATGLDPQSIEYGLYESQLASQLAALGYSVVQGEASQVATLEIREAVSQPKTRRGPVSVGGGGSVGSWGSGVSLGVGIDLSSLAGRPSEQIDRLVAGTIRGAGGGSNLWEGRAAFTATANSEYADPALAADRAISALFNGFPGESGETVTID